LVAYTQQKKVYITGLALLCTTLRLMIIIEWNFFSCTYKLHFIYPCFILL